MEIKKIDSKWFNLYFFIFICETVKINIKYNIKMNKNYDYEKNKPIDIIYILGAGHCGSTLLSLCLDRHKSVIGLSEIITLNRKSPGWSGSKFVLSDHFWSEVNRDMRERCGERLSEVPFNLRASMSSYDLAIKRNKIALTLF